MSDETPQIFVHEEIPERERDLARKLQRRVMVHSVARGVQPIEIIKEIAEDVETVAEAFEHPVERVAEACRALIDGHQP